jgi:ABC-type sugar transport system ATPase subunit/ribose/xylose/arabinose/galactoside ABC-type transport system permease subunit
MSLPGPRTTKPTRASEPQAGGQAGRAGRARGRAPSAVLGSFLFAARFAPIWIATVVLFGVAALIAPETLSSASFSSAVLPLTAFVAVAALGQMLVVMTGGIDLSMAGLITLIGSLLVGVSHGADNRLAIAIVICLGWAALAGLVNGLLVAVAELNPLIVTLATGEIMYGITSQYRLGTSNIAGVPPSLANWSLREFLGIGWIFWVGVLLTFVLAVLLRYTGRGRRFQAVGANRRAAWMSGLRVRFYVVAAYVACSLLGGVTAIMLSGLIQNPDTTLGEPYLLGPVAAVVIAGASLLGGLASATSTWVAAFTLTLLSQMLRVKGLSSALQYVVFGLAIIVGMLISGDRIAAVFGRFLARRGTRALLGEELDESDGDIGLERSALGVSALAVERGADGARAPAAGGRAGGAADSSHAITVLSLQGISKRFGAVQAVADVSIECYAGEIHAVVGENGSGKSTLLGVACGVQAPDHGVVEIVGQRLTVASTAATVKLGLGMAYQNYSQVLELSVAENLLLATPVDERPAYGEMNSWAASKLAEFDVALEPTVLAGSLSLAQRQFLEVVKALLPRPKVLLLDEPTTALGPGEVERLHALVQDRVAAGVGVVYVSHRLPEVLGLASRVTVLRDGVSQGTFDAAGLSEEALVTLMIGRPLQLAFPHSATDAAPDGVLLDIAGLRAERFGPIDLQLRPGEILGLAGAEGNGQGQFIRSLAGVEHAVGIVRQNGAKVDLRSPHGALDAGIVLLSADRARESLFPVLGIRANATLQVLARFSRLGWIARRKERLAVLALARRLKMRAASVEQPVVFLSGGNQQKVSLMRPFLRESVRVILADEPTQGVDVGSRFDIYQALREKSKEGVGVILKSSDPLELSGLCDRVIVMSRGRIVDEIPQAELVPAAEVGERRIIEAIVGSGRRPATQIAQPDVTAALEPSRAALGRHGLLRYRSWMSITLIALLMAAVAAYTASRSSAFSSSFNLNGLFIAVVPLALVSMGQLNAMLVGGFDVSVGAVMTLGVVLASFTMGAGEAWWELLLGGLAVIALAAATGALNASLIRIGKLSAIIATLATLSIFQGLALVLRPIPAGPINLGVVHTLTFSVGPIPISLIGVVIVAVAWDIWLYRSARGLATRAVGLDENSARRTGARAGRIFVRGFLLSALMAGVGSLFLAAQIDIGDPNSGLPFALESVAAAVLGGAALTGGRGSFIGAVIGALFLNLVINILPFLNISEAYGQIAVGGLTLAALSIYNGANFWRRIRRAVGALRSARLATD